MRTTPGLPDGTIVHLKGASKPPGRGTREQHRWVDAEQVRTGDTLIGNRGGVYRVLGTAWTEDHRIALTVQAPSGSVRTWIRAPGFGCDKA